MSELEGLEISIHALREEGDGRCCSSPHQDHQFLSTPSARRATSPLAHRTQADAAISIHALREEGDKKPLRGGEKLAYFYPRPPRGGRLRRRPPCFWRSPISIHALREEGDFYHMPFLPCVQDISIHALREESDKNPLDVV